MIKLPSQCPSCGGFNDSSHKCPSLQNGKHSSDALTRKDKRIKELEAAEQKAHDRGLKMGLEIAADICSNTPEPSLERSGYYAATSASDAEIQIRIKIEALEDL